MEIDEPMVSKALRDENAYWNLKAAVELEGNDGTR